MAQVNREHKANDGELERWRSLSVENINHDVVPGPDGMGEEVYAKSVADVNSAFGKMVDSEELLEEKLADAQVLLRDCHSEFDTAEASEFETEMRKKIEAFLSAVAQPAPSNCNCKSGKCEQWYLASDEVDEACKAVHGESQ